MRIFKQSLSSVRITVYYFIKYSSLKFLLKDSREMIKFVTDNCFRKEMIVGVISFIRKICLQKTYPLEDVIIKAIKFVERYE